MKPRRTCSDRARYHQLCELRKWYRTVLSATTWREGYGRKVGAIMDHPEVMMAEFDCGVTSYGTVILRNGQEIRASTNHGNKAMDKMATKLYRLFRHDLVKGRS